MGNSLQPKLYHKGSHKSISPRYKDNVDAYRTQQRISTKTNIHYTQRNVSEVSLMRRAKSATKI
jgi:hypothetical protein